MDKTQENIDLISTYDDFIDQIIFLYVDLHPIQLYNTLKVKSERVLLRAKVEYKDTYMKYNVDFSSYAKLFIEGEISRVLRSLNVTPKFIYPDSN